MTWAGTIAVLSSQPDLPGSLPLEPPFADKIAHAVAYGLLAVLVRSAGVAPAWTVVACVTWGINDELHQSVVPGRDASIGDLIADAFGATLAVWSWHQVARGRRRRR